MKSVRRSPAWLSLALLLVFGQSGCSPQRFFYYPNQLLYSDPDVMGVRNYIIHFSSSSGKLLWGLYLPCEGPPKGTIIHLHGNAANVTNHFPMALFLVRAGYDVLIFDYQGYGASEGRPTPQNTIDDGITSVHVAQNQLRGSPGIGVFGQSLGGAVAIVVAARVPAVKAAVVESAFTGYPAMCRAALGRHLWTWPLYPIWPLFMTSAYDPIRFVAEIAPRPVLFVHGDRDPVVPVRMSKALYRAAREPKALWIVPGAQHLEPHRVARAEYERRIETFFGEAMAKPGMEEKGR